MQKNVNITVLFSVKNRWVMCFSVDMFWFEITTVKILNWSVFDRVSRHSRKPTYRKSVLLHNLM